MKKFYLFSGLIMNIRLKIKEKHSHILFFLKLNLSLSLMVKFLRRMFIRRASIYEVKGLDQIKTYQEVVSSDYFLSHGQKTINKNSIVEIIPIPSIRYFTIKNAIINVNCSSFIKDGAVYMDRMNPNERLDVGLIHMHNQNLALVKSDHYCVIKEGFFLGGNGSWNWFHFLIEILPKLLFSKEISKNTNTLLVSSLVEKFPSMKAALDCMIDSRKWKIIYLKPQKNYLVRNLFLINDFNKVEFNKINENIKSSPTAYFRPKYTLELSKKLAKKISINQNYQNIFLWREGTHRIAKNQDEIFKFLEKTGFKKIDPASLTFEQQISVYQSAEFIIGTSGAAWANLIFCQENTNAIILSPQCASDFLGFSNLASIFKVNLMYLLYQTSSLDHCESDFTIDIEELADLLDSMKKRSRPFVDKHFQ